MENGYVKTNIIIELIKCHQEFVRKFEDNKNFYTGRNTNIRQNIDRNNPDNEINVPYARTMTKTIKGYMFKPGSITYSLETDRNQESMDLLLDLYKTNNEESENSELGADQSIYGIAFELLYSSDYNNKATPKFKRINPMEIIPIYDYTIDKNLISAIRYYKTKAEKDQYNMNVEVYYHTKIQYYTIDNWDYSRTNDKITITLVDEKNNYYNEVPIITYINNNEYQSDYETVRTLIILLDKLISDSANELDRFAAAYLIMNNYVLGGNDEERSKKLERLKKLRVFEIEDNGDVKFLTKDIPVEFFKEIKDSIKQMIIEHSGIPDFNDQSFGTASGIAIKYKLIGLENICADKESYFKAGLYRRINLIMNYLKIENNNYDLTNIKINFTRNLPENITEAIDNFKKIDPDGGIISKDTALSLLPFIKNSDDEIVKIDEENSKREKMKPDISFDDIPNETSNENVNMESVNE